MRLGMPVFDSEYFEKVTRAAKGHGSGTGGLSKLSVAQLMEWACCKHIVKSKNVHVGSFSKDTKAYRYVAWFCLVSLQNRKGMRRSSKQLRATLKKKLSAVLAMMQEEASGPVGQEGR